jgi:predicted RNase H-like nuclease
MLVLGVDGCREGWVVVALDDGAFAGASRFETFDEVLAVGVGAEAIGVDMPIGLLGRGARACDRLVRAELGPRRSSVFAVPPRAALMQETYADANAACARLAGFGLSKQLWNLKAKILEVDSALAKAHRHERSRRTPRSESTTAKSVGRRARHAAVPWTTPTLDGLESLRRRARVLPPDERNARGAKNDERVVEVHPEASFRELAGAPLVEGKKSYDGVMRRLALLEGAGIVLPRVLSIGRVGIDDVLDAAAAAWSASRVALGVARRVPNLGAKQRDRGRTVAIWI